MSASAAASAPARLPSVGVVVPCYNYARFLPHNLDALLAQDGVDLDVVVIDDCSSDDSHAVAQSYAARDPRVRAIRHESNRGHIATYNEGLAQVRGDYLVLISADDVLTPGSLARSARALAAHPAAGLAYGAVIRHLGDGEPAAPRRAGERFRVIAGRTWLARRCRRMTNTIYSPEAMLRRAVYERIGPYDARLTHTGDFAMWLAAAARTDVIRVQAPAAFYRTHAANMHAHTETLRGEHVHAMLFDLEQRRTTVESVLGDPEIAAGTGRYRRTALHRLAEEAFELACRAYTWGLVEAWPVDELIAFGLSCRPDPAGSRAWRRLAARRRLGAERSRRNPRFVVGEKLAGYGKALQGLLDRTAGA